MTKRYYIKYFIKKGKILTNGFIGTNKEEAERNFKYSYPFAKIIDIQEVKWLNFFNWVLVFTSLVGVYYAYGFYQQKKVIEFQNGIFNEINQKILNHEEKMKKEGKL